MRPSVINQFTFYLLTSLIFFSCTVYGTTEKNLDISQLRTDASAMAHMQWLQNNTENWQDIANSTEWKPLETPNFGYLHKPVWTKLTLFNSNTLPIELIVYNNHPGMDDLKVTLQFSEGSNNNIQSFQLGLLYPIEQQALKHRLSSFFLTLKPQQTVVIYTRSFSLGSMQIDWHLTPPEKFIEKTVMDNLLWGIFGGLILCFVIYNFVVMRRFSAAILWPYILFALLSLYYQYAIKGFLRFEPTGWISQEWISFSTWYVPFFLLIALATFSMMLFNTVNLFPRLHQALKASIIIYALVAGFHILGAWYPQALEYSEPGLLIAFIGFILPFVVAIFVLIKNLPGAQYFFIGQLALASGHLIQLGVLMGLLPNTELMSFSIPMGILLDITFSSLAFSQRVADVKAQHEKQRKLMLIQTRFSSLGQAFGTIANTWKQPLDAIENQIENIEHLFSMTPKPLLTHQLIPLIIPINQSIRHLSDTIENFRYFYQVDSSPTTFNITTELNKILTLLKSKQTASNTDLILETPKEKWVTNYRSDLSQVILLILDPLLSFYNSAQVPKNINISIHQDDNKNQIELVFQLPSELVVCSESWLELNFATTQILAEERLQGFFSRNPQEIHLVIALHLKALS